MTIYRSHRLEVLAQVLCDLLVKTPSPDPFEPEWVVVPTSGVERWLSMQVAQTLGVAANFRFLFPAQLVSLAMDAVLGDKVANAYDSDCLAWTILDVLPDLLDRDEFAPLRAFLEKRDHPVSRRELVLARRLAETFDHYLLYGHNILLRWARGEASSKWQAQIWRAVWARLGPLDPAEHINEFLQVLNTSTSPIAGLPHRLLVFGISALPPWHLEVFNALARHLEVHLLVLAPSREWFGDALTAREAARDGLRSRNGSGDYGGKVHPLLAAFGRLSRDFQAAVLDAEERGATVCDLFDEEPLSQTLLACLQRDILAAELPAEKHIIESSDKSIRIHACHSPMRQVEVLRDALLALFDADYTLEPRDVLVMTPDIGGYAPLIEAVFGDADERLPQIPYQIADRSIARENPAAAVVSRVLNLARGRLPASEVLDLLAAPVVARRFEMCSDDLARAREMVRRSGIRFGLDEDHVAGLGLPRTDENTWRFGLDRLLVGAAMAQHPARMFGDVFPCDVAPDFRGTLPKLVTFCETLFDILRLAQSPKSLADWVAFTEQVLDRLVGQGEENAGFVLEAREIARRILGKSKGPCRLLTLDAWAAVWEASSSDRSGSRAFFCGGVTFASLVPLRSLPFRVIALMGLDDMAFPRQDTSFGSLGLERLPGDRSRRDEDLQLFLEALMSAREHLIITYTGLGVRDNQPIPPAIPVAQLLDALDASFKLDNGLRPSEVVVVRHPLHPYSPRVFSRPDVPAFDWRFEAAARSLITLEPESRRPRLEGLVTAVNEPGQVVTLDTLARFFQHPIKFFLERLGFRPEVSDVSIEDRTPVVLEDLARYGVGEEIVTSMLLRGEDLNVVKHRLRRAGRLPRAALAEVEFALICGMAEHLLEAVKELVSGQPQEVHMDLEVDEMRLVGRLYHMFPIGLVSITFSKNFPARLFRLWVFHLAASLAFPSYSGQAFLVTRDTDKPTMRFQPLADNPKEAAKVAKAHLKTLLGLYRLGNKRPLPLFARASSAYAEKFSLGGGDDALRSARKVFNDWERVDPYIKFAFGDVASPEEIMVEGVPSFADLAMTVYGPMLSALGGERSL